MAEETSQIRRALGPPERIVLCGNRGRLEPLNCSNHGSSLWEAIAGHHHIWTFLPWGPWDRREEFEIWLQGQESTTERLYYSVVDGASNRALGCASFHDVLHEHGVIEIGAIFFSPALQRTALATEALYLMASYAFDTLHYRRLQWRCNNANEPSKNAALRLGFVPEGLFRQHMVVKGRNRDTAWFSILDSEWPARKARLEQWLHPENFDSRGVQKSRLQDLLASAQKVVARRYGLGGRNGYNGGRLRS